MRLSVLCAAAFLACAGLLRAQETAPVRVADGFQLPVGVNGSGEGYYIARGYRPNGHLGEDWNGVRGGDTDLGDPVYATAHGRVMFAKNYHVGWGNVVILRHAYYEGSVLKYVDSLYGHLLDFKVAEGEEVKRGQLIGHIGNNNGMYEAHLHFEMRKNLTIGMYRSSFARDFSNYWSPNEFVAAHRTCPNGNRTASVPINTYPAVAPPVLPGPKVETPVFAAPKSSSFPMVAASSVQKSSPAPIAAAPASQKPSPSPAAATFTPKKSSKSSTTAAVTSTPKPSKASTTIAAETSALKSSAVITDESSEPEKKEAGTASRRPAVPFRVDRYEDLRRMGY